MRAPQADSKNGPPLLVACVSARKLLNAYLAPLGALAGDAVGGKGRSGHAHGGSGKDGGVRLGWGVRWVGCEAGLGERGAY